ncbi:hypothetical protein [Agarivorans sp. 1_MG-2023]|uniref:hypothetical protein n=1 Tax=Agarivorans sp. 1_MG-2023 TaxID=3062634 RepID=UPI0026E13880|nr:hypothetical protein [Agarivorans sp. 1_MG-2023]MDO6762907.1 hypothetical protein [Agarivorans sp. 1_MG-2023]
MLAFISRFSTQLLASCVLVGFALPNFSNALLPLLPAVLFFLMLLTIVSLNIKTLVTDLAQASVWLYAVWHTFGVTILIMTLAWLLNIDSKLYLAIAATCATGSLFASPAIVRSLGLDAQRCMAMTIASTLLMPLVLLLNGWLFSRFNGNEQLQLDMQTYSLRLAIFIVLPIMISLLVHKLLKQSLIEQALKQIRPFTIVLVFFFPLGLMGAFREIFDETPSKALEYLLIASGVCLVLFISSFLLYYRQGKNLAIISAITATNRNVLLTYSITGSFLGLEYMIYMGAIQLPIYLLPMLVKLAVRPS